MVTPHPLAAAAVEVRAEELRARADEHRSIKLGHGHGGRPTSGTCTFELVVPAVAHDAPIREPS